MTLNNKVYDVLKYIAQVGLPALAVFIATVGPKWDMPKVDAIVVTVVALDTLLGALLLINQAEFNRTHDIVPRDKDYTP